MIGIKDLDRKLSDFLEDKDVFSLICVNKYYSKVFNEEYWKRRLISKFSDILPKNYNIYNETWKKYYLMVSHFLNQDYYTSITFCIKEDRVDLLEIFYQKYNCNLNILRDWYKKRESCIPINLAVENDSIKCFKYISENLEIYSPTLNLSRALDYHAHNIVDYLKEYIEEGHIMSIFEHDCLVCAEKLNKFFYKNDIIYELHYYKTLVEKILKIYNETFALFVKNINYDELLKYKNACLKRNHYDVAKCLTKYTTIINN